MHKSLLILVVVNSAKSSSEALIFWCANTAAHIFIFYLVLEHNDKIYQLSVKYLSAAYWESQINCIAPLSYCCSDMVGALKELESYCLKRKV